MSWNRHQIVRLSQERDVLRREFPLFGFFDPRGSTYVAGNWTTNLGNDYTLRVNIPAGYPDECPSTYIVRPSPLLGWKGRRTMESHGSSHEMHTWRTDHPGWVKICTYRPDLWSADHSIVKIIRKGMLWLVAYECHLQDGSPLNRFLMD
ncbi:hypothetical protein [Actinomadura rugatobispora]|uniref:Uncharacterized protein n=1 Tax=Actinomadura rugatobispora TaxID=1994 RepID=A0ABW0ZSN1_9ACTN|nr:hypothetical protein GCM10010200_110850 [Actinomadura rugatobispora]